MSCSLYTCMAIILNFPTCTGSGYRVQLAVLRGSYVALEFSEASFKVLHLTRFPMEFVTSPASGPFAALLNEDS